jgi:hypothetical protein
MASKIIVDQLQTTSLALNALTLPASNATANQYLQDNGSGVLSWSTVNSPAFTSYAVIADEKTLGTSGGTFTAGAWQTRDLQTKVTDEDVIVTIATNAFTLTTGSYLINWSAPAIWVDGHQTRLYDVTGSAVVESGTTEYAVVIPAGYPATMAKTMTRSSGFARVSIAGASNVYRIEHKCAVTKASTGFGIGISLSTEVYTQVAIYKEA